MRNPFDTVSQCRHCGLDPSERGSRIRKTAHRVLLIGCVPLMLAACGSSSASGSVGSSSSSVPKSSATASRTAYTNCLKQHGVTISAAGGGGIPSGAPPSFGSEGAAPAQGNLSNNPAFQKASNACKSLRPSGGFGGPSGSGGFNSSAFAAYRNCLKLHGVTLPTGGAANSAGSTPSTTLSQSSPTVKAALQACAALQPSASSTTTSG
jgi:hypothetical protein